MSNLNNKPVTFLERVITRFAGTSVDAIVEKKMAETQNQSVASDVLRFSPREIAFPGGSVRKPYPLGITFLTLRELADYYPIARSVIEFRKSQITHLEWQITPLELTDKAFNNKDNIDNGKKIKEFFRHPTGKKDSSWTTWIKQMLEDLLVIDAVAIYRKRNRKGDITGYLPIDGASIELILEKDGTTPEPPNDAYIQKVKGMTITKLTTDDLIYTMLTPRTNHAYGFSPLETLIITVSTALKLQAFNFGYLSEGNVPEGFVTLPKEIASSRDQLKEWQDAWDSMLSGDPRFQRKLKFLPEGMKYEPTVKVEDMTFERFEKWLLQNVCFDEETEILTDNGWQFFNQLKTGNKVATRSDNGEFEWQKPTNYTSYEHNGSMIEFKNRSIDLLVTPDHRMVTTFNHGIKRGFSPLVFRRAEELVSKDGYFMPMTSTWHCAEMEYFQIPSTEYEDHIWNKKITRKVEVPGIKSEDWIAFFGLWLAEGFTRKNSYVVGISQSVKSKYYSEIEKLLLKLPFKWRREGHDWVCNNKALWEFLKVFGGSKTKRIPRYFLDLTPDLLVILWEWAVKGDGQIIESGTYGRKITSRKLYSGNKEMLGDFQELLQKIGRDGTIMERKPAGGIIRGKKMMGGITYILTERFSAYRKLRGRYTSYQGKVYCVTVPNSTLYVRRNGKPAWVGNCAVYGVPPTAIGFNFETNRSTAQTSWEAGKERGLFPTALFVKELMDRIIQEDFEHPELEFSWSNMDPTNKQEEANVLKILINSGLMAIDEWRIGEGLKPTGASDPFIMTPVGPIFVKDLAKQSNSGQMPILPYKPAAEAAAQSQNAGNAAIIPNVPPQANTPPAKPVPAATKPNVNAKTKPAKSNKIDDESLEEIKRWKRTAIKDIREGKSPRNFKTDILDTRTQELIRKGLGQVKSRVDIEKLFQPFVDSQNKLIGSLIDLYDELDDYTRYDFESTGSESTGS